MSCTSLVKREHEKKLWPVQYLSDFGTFVIEDVTVTAYDADGYPVTDFIIDPSYTTWEGNTANFMAIDGEPGATYTIYVASTMSDGEELIWRGSLTILEE